MRELFVYYRVAAPAAASVQARVEALQRRLRDEIPGLRARLLRRPRAEAAGQITFMETYAIDPAQAADAAPAGVDEAMQSRIEAAARALDGLEGPRHVEVFVACGSD